MHPMVRDIALALRRDRLRPRSVTRVLGCSYGFVMSVSRALCDGKLVCRDGRVFWSRFPSPNDGLGLPRYEDDDSLDFVLALRNVPRLKVDHMSDEELEEHPDAYR